MGCNVCREDKLNTLIESTKISNMVWWAVGHELKRDTIQEEDNSLVLEIRNSQGYLRLGDRGDMGCLDHSGKIKINFCPVCGRKISNDA